MKSRISDDEWVLMNKNNLKIITCRDLKMLLPWRSQWDEMANDNPMLGFSWQTNWWTAFTDSGNDDKKKLAVALFVDPQDRLTGIVPCYIATTSAARVLRFLGDGKVCSDYLRLHSRQGDEERVASRAAQWIQSVDFIQQFGALDRIECEGHRSDEPTLKILWEKLSASNWIDHTTPIEGSWQTVVPSEWPVLRKSFCKSHQRKSNKARRLMDENQIEVHWLKTPRQCEENWSDFVHLHQKRRAELGQPGCFADPQFEYFLRQVVLELSSSGQAILGLVKHQQKSIAATLLLMSSDTASMYQSGIDPEFSHLEPGHLINNFSLQWTQQQGKTTFDFLRGDESYKRGWGATRTELYRTRMIAPRWSSKLKHSLWLMARRAKKMVVDTASPNSQVTSATEEVKSC